MHEDRKIYSGMQDAKLTIYRSQNCYDDFQSFENNHSECDVVFSVSLMVFNFAISSV